MDWLAFVAFGVLNIIVFFIGRHFGEKSANRLQEPPFKRLHAHIATLEAALREASLGATIEQTRKGLRVDGIEVRLITGGRRREFDSTM